MTLKELQELRASLAKQIRDHVAESKTRAGSDAAAWCAEDEAKYTALNADYDTNYAALEAAQAAATQADAVAERIAALGEHDRRPAYAARIGRENARGDEGSESAVNPWDSTRHNAIASQAIRAWVLGDSPDSSDEMRNAAARCGINPASRELRIPLSNNFGAVRGAYRNALSGGDGTTGAFLRPETLVGSLETNMLAYGSVLQVAEVIRTGDSNPLRWPTADDTSNSGVQLGESGAVADLDPSFAQVVWYAYKFSSKAIKVPYELLRDSAIDLAPVIGQMLGERLGRILSTKFTTGTGAGTPKGVVTASTLGVTAASATAIAYDEIIDLEHSIDPSYRGLPGTGYMFHDSILKAIRKLKTGTGEYLWSSGTAAGMPDLLNGRPYTINQDMQSSIATATKTILFGHFPHYKVRQVDAVRLYRLTERYRDNDQDGFFAFVEADGNLLSAGTSPIKHLLQA